MKKYSLLIQQYRNQDMKNVNLDELNSLHLQDANCDCDCCDSLNDFYDDLCDRCSCDCDCCDSDSCSCDECGLCACERNICEGCCDCYENCTDTFEDCCGY